MFSKIHLLYIYVKFLPFCSISSTFQSLNNSVSKRFLMKLLGISLLIVGLMAVFMLPGVLAHAPLSGGDNESLATATIIPDPTKSWAAYGELHEGGEAQYYRFLFSEGQEILVSLFISPASKDVGFLPALVLMGPSVSNQGTVPDYVEVPEGSGAMVVEGKLPAEATYEPFSPSSFYSLATMDLNAPSSGTYYVAVYEPYLGGHYGLAVGYRETYTLQEWILIPINLISIYQWEGQSLPFILAPMGVILVVGLALILWRRRNREPPMALFNWTGALAGLLFMGSGVTVLSQMTVALTRASLVPEVGVTLVFAVIPILLGVAALRLALKTEERIKVRKRVYFVILGMLALFAWSGLLVGPILAIVTSFLPSRTRIASRAQPV